MYPNGTASGVVVTPTYPHLGQRTVTLTVTDNGGKTNSIAKVVTVGTVVDNPPVSKFAVNCTNLSCTLNGTTSTDDGTISAYQWGASNATSSAPTGSIASDTYATAGSKTVTLTVTDNSGQTSTSTQTFSVSAANAPPVAAFTANRVYLTCSLNGGASTDDATIMAYAWSAAGATPSAPTGSATSVTYAAPGTYNVTLTVTDNGRPYELRYAVRDRREQRAGGEFHLELRRAILHARCDIVE